MNMKFNEKKNRDFFNWKVNEYDLSHEEFMTTKKALTDNLDENVSNILDLGAGTGLELIELFKRYPQINVTAVDISENMLQKLKEREFGKKVRTICGSFFDVEFGSNYDAAISTSALHHFLKKDKFVLYKKVFDSLKEGGLFLNSDKIVLTNEEEQTAIEFYNNNINKCHHIDTPLSIEHEIEVLKEVGFKDVEVEEVEKDNYRLFKARK